VIAVDSGKIVTIIGVDYSGRFSVRDQYGMVYSNIDRTNLAVMSGSSGDIYTGQSVIAVDSGKDVTVIGIQWNSRFVVRDQYGMTYTNIDRYNIAVKSGASQGLYVGQQVTAIDSGKRVTIIAIQLNGRFVVRDMYGMTYSNIDRYNLTNY
jgi:hypothetical protein